ncbi:hypothetical protein JKP88DRAFT_300703 [Tribonema minus]|uniref:Uncharacterized protein n=1 Tax=Tribonema minus TaxID=303371 RepID=A0A836CKN8_9STRA|nr:hypothetical protein JKP88DRAFT_300703 [Tribonema minus]
MPALFQLELRGDFSKAGGIRLPEQLKCLQLFKFEPTGLQHLTELMLCGRPAGHDAVLIPLSPRLRRLCLDVDFADDRTLELPPLQEELVIGAGVTRPFALPLPPGLCRELCLYRALTIALPLDGDEQEQLHEPHDIAWPASIRSLVLRYWEVGMDLPRCITSLSLTETLPFTLDNLVFNTALALESLYTSGLSGGTHDIYERLGDHWEMVRLPASIKKLTLGPYINNNAVHRMMENGLPPALEELKVESGSDFNAPLTALPPTLQVLHLNKTFDAPLENVPAGLQEAVLPTRMRLPLQAGALPLPPAARVSFI